MKREDYIQQAARQFKDGKALVALAYLRELLKDTEIVIRVWGVLKVKKDYSEASIEAAIAEVTG